MTAVTVTADAAAPSTTGRRTAGLVVIALSASFGVALWVALWFQPYHDSVRTHGPLSSEFSGGESFSCPSLADAPFTFSSPIGEITYARQPCEKARSTRRTVLAMGEAGAVLGVTVGVVILLRASRQPRLQVPRGR